ncbi:FitA-like ribbon-helix-helix domain-containing protein [Thiohalophilus sp.]|uniref:FitA-like ribbon-helix-helix domain-containing protein n=1 Tax=Thiohalophilus sp. TaxID=3028392 RepID=UPI002ACE5F52|nr:hypothetical protein [Thiohalophilus sp.]MDZ7804361.1 hypothetical protein [Thiohalophilus sp.]
MATVTVRNLPDNVVERLKQAAEGHQHSMEQEVRALLQRYYGPREEILSRVRERWTQMPPLSPEDVADWRNQGRR